MPICSNCHNLAHRVKGTFNNGKYQEQCEYCSRLHLLGGPKTDGILTRTSYRVTRDQEKNEGDLIIPHKYNKISRKHELDPEFVKRFPDAVHIYEPENEIAKQGYAKLATRSAKIKAKKQEIKVRQRQEIIKADGDVEKAKQAMGKFMEMKGVPKAQIKQGPAE